MTDTISRIDPQVSCGNIGDRWGRLVARRRWVVLAIWTLLAVGSAILYPALQNSLVGANFSVPGTESSRADQLVEQHFHRGLDQRQFVR